MGNRPKQGKVIPFEIDEEVYARLGTRYLDKNDLVEAISQYQFAAQCNPDNWEYRLSIAEVLTEMQLYDESNRILLPMLIYKEIPAECFFGAACNFMGLRDYSHAYSSLENYLTLEPEGEFAQSAADQLDYMDEQDGLRDAREIQQEEQEQAAIKLSGRCKAMLEAGKINDAIKLLKEGVKDYPSELYIRNNLAMAHYCARDVDSALAATEAVLKIDPDNIQAKCNRVLFLRHKTDEAELAETLQELRDVDLEDPDDLNRIALVMLEMDEYEDALRRLLELRANVPYDKGTLHRTAYCYYQMGQYARAKQIYEQLTKMDHDDTVAQYYFSCCAKTVRTGKVEENSGWLTAYQVPFDEMLRRISALNDEIRKPFGELKEKWENDRNFRNMLRWGMELTDQPAKRALLVLIAAFGDMEAELFLREYLLMREQSDALKNEVFGLLKRMDAPEPYLAYLNDELVQGKVNIASFPSQDMPETYQQMFQIMLGAMQDVRSEQCIMQALTLCEQCVRAWGEFPKLHPSQVQATAAAFDYLAGKECKEDTTKGEICDRYDISLAKLNGAIRRIKRVLEQKPAGE